MKLTKWTILIPSLLASVYARGQDTTSIYFEFGSSKIPDAQLETLNSIPANYNLSDLDSIHFIGTADSVGDLKSNFKLAEKRASHVAKYCERVIPGNVTYKVSSLGEIADADRNKSRRVDIIFYFQPSQPEEVLQKETFETKDACFNIDYTLLHRCHVRTITKRNTKLVVIESILPDLKKKNEHYYGSRTKDGDFVTTKIKWTSKKIGNLWWSETRYVATIPKNDFDDYKIFTIKIPPCDSCSESFGTGTKISNEDTCMQLERFLMNNLQFKTSFFNNSWVKIRAPREYVDIEDRYFIDCSLDNELTWETKKGKRHQNYYYSKLPVYFHRIANITRMMGCCKSNPEPSECDSSMIYCATIGETDRSFKLIAEAGSTYQQTVISPYAVLGISKAGYYSEVSLLAGTDIDLSLYSSLRYQYNFLSFPFSMLNPASTWQKPGERQVIYKYGRLYLGTELKARINKTMQDHLEQNVHIGLSAINTKSNSVIERIFIQYGLGIDYFGNTSQRVYSIIQLGIDMKLIRLSSN